MSQYRAPLAEMQFVMTELAASTRSPRCPVTRTPTPDVVSAVLEEAGKFATNVLDPLNWPGDQEGANGSTTARSRRRPVSSDAYWQFCENGWNGLAKSTEFGGQGLPQLVATAVEEMWTRRTSRSSCARC